MRLAALFANLHRHHRKGVFACVPDSSNVRHVIRTRETELHAMSALCYCQPRVRDVVDEDGYRMLVVIHRKVLNSRALFKPWERGH